MDRQRVIGLEVGNNPDQHRGHRSNILTQVGFIVLIGLAAKNSSTRKAISISTLLAAAQAADAAVKTRQQLVRAAADRFQREGIDAGRGPMKWNALAEQSSSLCKALSVIGTVRPF
jgi:hypothetical protein